METRVTQMGGWVGRFPAARVMSVLAVAGALLGALAQPAVAQTPDPNTSVRMDFFKLKCVTEQGDGIFVDLAAHA